MSEMNLRHLGFTYSACRPPTKTNERINKIKEIVDSRNIYQKNSFW